jgi:hypothetical protein
MSEEGGEESRMKALGNLRWTDGTVARFVDAEVEGSSEEKV